MSTIAVALAVALALVPVATTAKTAAKPATRVTVMTRNLYLGTNLLPLATTAPGAPFKHAVDAALAGAESTGPVARMKLIAKEIAGAKPDLVGLQEVTRWSTGAAGHQPTRVVIDYLKTIMSELKRLHASYRVAASRLSLHLQGQGSAQEVGFSDGNAILVRTGVSVSRVRSSDFKHELVFPTPALGSVRVSRSWIALDATVRGARFHFVDSHLEAYSTGVRLQQAQELVAGPLKSKLQTILVGDLNSSANLPNAADRPPFQAIAAAGFTDERTLRPNCCFNDDLKTGKWDHIVDHIMAKPAVTLVRSFITGRETTAAGRHPSDHGGVVSVLVLK
jgi:endonuclease/exonuclease/phosphatase family metal-dependent hydrolase